jgi:hypothetical protein
MRVIAWLFLLGVCNMCELLNEQRMTLADLARQENVSVCTCWRWAGRGVRGVRLETFNVGARRFTTREAFSRWVAATQVEPPTSPQARTTRQRAMAIKAAEAELAKAGV